MNGNERNSEEILTKRRILRLVIDRLDTCASETDGKERILDFSLPGERRLRALVRAKILRSLLALHISVLGVVFVWNLCVHEKVGESSCVWRKREVFVATRIISDDHFLFLFLHRSHRRRRDHNWSFSVGPRRERFCGRPAGRPTSR